MHPGPMNRGVEIDPALADGERSVILDQVEAGVAVRMAVLYLLAKEVGGQDAGTGGARCRLRPASIASRPAMPTCCACCAARSSACSRIRPASIARLRHAHAVLLAAGCDVRALFGPEHGYGGEAQDMIARELASTRRAACRCIRCTARAKTICMPKPEMARRARRGGRRSAGRRQPLLHVRVDGGVHAAPHRAARHRVDRARSAEPARRRDRRGRRRSAPAIAASSACTTSRSATA